MRELGILLRDEMLDLEQPVEVVWGGKQVFSGKVLRTAAVQAETLARRGDPKLIFSARLVIVAPDEQSK